MAPETTHGPAVPASPAAAPSPPAGSGVPLLTLVLSGALRMRADGVTDRGAPAGP